MNATNAYVQVKTKRREKKTWNTKQNLHFDECEVKVKKKTERKEEKFKSKVVEQNAIRDNK